MYKMAEQSEVVRNKEPTRYRRREHVQLDIYRLLKDRRGESLTMTSIPLVPTCNLYVYPVSDK
jgi:hypothetical protein